MLMVVRSFLIFSCLRAWMCVPKYSSYGNSHISQSLCHRDQILLSHLAMGCHALGANLLPPSPSAQNTSCLGRSLDMPQIITPTDWHQLRLQLSSNYLPKPNSTLKIHVPLSGLHVGLLFWHLSINCWYVVLWNNSFMLFFFLSAWNKQCRSA